MNVVCMGRQCLDCSGAWHQAGRIAERRWRDALASWVGKRVQLQRLWEHPTCLVLLDKVYSWCGKWQSCCCASPVSPAATLSLRA